MKRSDLPDDDNADVLWRMVSGGDDLSIPRDIDFTVVFSVEADAEGFAGLIRPLGHKVKMAHSQCVPELPWDVVVTRHMVPAHAAITRFEDDLARLASRYGGRNDGWGCFAQRT